MKQIRIGEVEIPHEYFSYSKEKKEELCNELLNAMLLILEDQIPSQYNKKEVLDEILESSIITNIEDEVYEVCQVFHDVRNLLNEQPD
jgi:predicted nucleotidyltransferase